MTSPLTCPVCKHDHAKGNRSPVLGWIHDTSNGPVREIAVLCHGEHECFRRWVLTLKGQRCLSSRPLGRCKGPTRPDDITVLVGIVPALVTMLDLYEWPTDARRTLAEIYAALDGWTLTGKR